MKKIISLVMVTMMAASAYAFVPLSNSHDRLDDGIGINAELGSYQRGATRGMFYNELDIISASPVELLDFSGNVLYTQWGNMRQWNDIAGYGKALEWNNDATADVGYFNIGVTGNPFSYLNIEDSRSGIVFQNYGSKTTSFNLDGDAGTGSGTGLDSEGYIEVDVGNTANVAASSITVSDMEYWQNEQVSQWNVGTSYKLNDTFALGLSMAKIADKKTLTTSGQKTYIAQFNTPEGALNAGRPGDATYMDSLSIAYPTQEIDNESEYMTDILPQARISVSDSFHVDVAIGVRKWTRNGVDAVVGTSSNSITAVTVTAAEDCVVAADWAIPTELTQHWMTGTAIVGKTQSAVNLDYDATGNVTNQLAGLQSVVFKRGTNDAGVSAVEDDRSGVGPLIRLEAVKKFEKVDLTAIYNYGSVSQDIGASRTDREYILNSCIISTFSSAAGAAGVPYGTPVSDTFVEKDYIKNYTYTGQASRGNMDIGGKIAFKAMEGVKLSIGGFLSKQVVKQNYTTTEASYEFMSYEDGYSSTDTVSWGMNPVTLGAGLVSSGTISAANRPGAIATSAQGESRTATALGAGMTLGNGEGTWAESILRDDEMSDETVTMVYSVPVGVEIPLSKKWTFRAGTEYQLTKTKTTVESKPGVENISITSTPAGETATLSDFTDYSRVGNIIESVYKAESHTVFYTYGVQFDATPSLSIACNAFLDTNSIAADDVSGTSKASFLDLGTYRNLSLSASFKF